MLKTLLQAQSSTGVIKAQTNNDLDLKTNSTTFNVRIENGGNVGIGTTSPSNLELYVGGAAW